MKKKTANLAQEDSHEENESRLCAFLLSAPTAHACKQACEHLRYWPYVKEFHPMNKSSGKLMKVHVLIGKCENRDEFWSAVDRATELMNQCLRQYQCVMVDLGIPKLFQPLYEPELFLRPDNLNLPFISFIMEVDASGKRPNHSISNHSTLNSKHSTKS